MQTDARVSRAEQDLLSGAALAAFRLNGQFLALAEELAVPAEYRDNPAHRRAKLLAPTAAGRGAVKLIGPAHARAARALTKRLGAARFAEAVAALRDLSAALDRGD